jgi:hypothetical protein
MVRLKIIINEYSYDDEQYHIHINNRLMKSCVGYEQLAKCIANAVKTTYKR